MKTTLLCALTFCAVLVAAHVPNYESAKCVKNTIVEAKVSQVTYFEYAKPGQVVGLTLDLTEKEDIWTELGSGLVASISASRWNELQDSDFFIGCLPAETIQQLCDGTLSSFPGGGETLIKSEGSHEPFTQSVHYPVEPQNDSKVYQTNCTRDQVLALLAKPGTGGGRFSVVLGVSELFTLEQLISFPIFMARNHGSFVNVNYNYWIVCVLIVLALKMHAIMSIVTNGYNHYTTRLLGDSTSLLRKLAALACLASICVYFSVIVDITLQSTFASQQDNIGKTSMGLFIGLVLFLANIMPMLLAVYTWRRLLTIESSNTVVTISYAVVVGILTTICFTSLVFLGEAPQVPVLLSIIAGLTLIGIVAVVTNPAIRRHVHVYPLIVQISLFVLYLFFLGSGYWIGPGLMIFASSVLVVHTLQHIVDTPPETPTKTDTSML